MGSVCSAIGTGVNSIIAAIANLLMAVVGAFTVVIVTVFDVIVDILCCRCDSPGRRVTRRRHYDEPYYY